MMADRQVMGHSAAGEEQAGVFKGENGPWIVPGMVELEAQLDLHGLAYDPTPMAPEGVGTFVRHVWLAAVPLRRCGFRAMTQSATKFTTCPLADDRMGVEAGHGGVENATIIRPQLPSLRARYR
jgi:hypothetical protein